MQAKPVRKCRTPAYPGKLEILQRPDLLLRRMPAHWKRLAELAGTAAVLVAASNLGGCDRTARTSGAPASSAYMSEEEASQIIKEELGKAGVTLTQSHVAHEKVLVPQQELKEQPGEVEGHILAQLVMVAKPLQVDLEDPEHRVAVDFVSMADYVSLDGGRTLSPTPSTNSAMPLGNSFQKLSQDLERLMNTAEPNLRYRAFYDPQVFDKSESQRLLRQQVAEFVQWLQAQGAI